jgi:hypothetical protein
MKSHKIQKLEFVSDKIEGGDCKREVMCIRFGHPTKKNELGWGSRWEAAMAGVGASWEPWGAHRRGEGGGREEEAGGALLGAPSGEGGAARSSWLLVAAFHVLFVLNVRRKQQAGRRRREGGKREEKEMEGKEKEEKIWKLFQTWKFLGRKIKDNLWSWKNYFCTWKE